MVKWRQWLWGGHFPQRPVADPSEAVRTGRDPRFREPGNEPTHGVSPTETPDTGETKASKSASEGVSERERTSAKEDNPAAGLEAERKGYEDVKQEVLSKAARLFSRVWLPRLLADFATAQSRQEELLALVFEVLLWEELRDGRMKIDRRKTISGEGVSARYYKPDFVLYQRDDAKLIIECDGWMYHRASPEQFAYELKRERELQRLGYRLYRFAASDVIADPWAAALEVIEVMNEVWPEFSPILLPPEVYSLVRMERQPEQQRLGAEAKQAGPEVTTARNGLEDEEVSHEEVSLEEVAHRIRGLPLKRETLPSNIDSALRRSYARAYEPWSEQEDFWLAHHAKVPGISVDVLCEAFQRHPGSIKSRLKRLGISEQKHLKKMLARVNLRNSYRIYEVGNSYVVRDMLRSCGSKNS